MNDESNRISSIIQFSMITNVIGVSIGLWFAFYPKPVPYAFILTAAFPLIYLAIFFRYKRFIKFNKSSFAFIVCSMTLMIRAIMDYQIIEYRNLFISTIVITLVITLALVKFSTEFSIRKSEGLVITFSSAFFILFYGFGVSTIANCVFDSSKPEITRTTIAEKKVTYGSKSSTYHFYLNPWGPMTEKEHVTPTYEQYHKTNVGDTVEIESRKGILNAPWYSVRLND